MSVAHFNPKTEYNVLMTLLKPRILRFFSRSTETITLKYLQFYRTHSITHSIPYQGHHRQTQCFHISWWAEISHC